MAAGRSITAISTRRTTWTVLINLNLKGYRISIGTVKKWSQSYLHKEWWISRKNRMIVILRVYLISGNVVSGWKEGNTILVEDTFTTKECYSLILWRLAIWAANRELVSLVISENSRLDYLNLQKCCWWLYDKPFSKRLCIELGYCNRFRRWRRILPKW